MSNNLEQVLSGLAGVDDAAEFEQQFPGSKTNFDALLAALTGADLGAGYMDPGNEAGARQRYADEHFMAETPGEKAPTVGPLDFDESMPNGPLLAKKSKGKPRG